MAITINGTSGISGVDGSASSPAIQGTDTNTGISFPAADTVAVNTGGSERVRCDSSGRVGIGTSPSQRLHVGNTADNTKLLVSSSFEAALELQNGGGSELNVINSAGSGNLSFRVSNSEKARLDSSGRLLVGTSTTQGKFYNGSGVDHSLQIETTTAYGQSWVSHGTSAGFGAHLTIGRSRGTSAGSVTVVQVDDSLGHFSFQGADGTEFVEAAKIQAFVDGTPGANDMPGRLVFSTTPDSSATPVERMRIESNQNVRFSNVTTVFPLTDNVCGLGASGFRWSAVWAANGTIQTSDQRAKSDITTATLGSDFIKSLRPVSYKWIEGGKRDTGERDEDNNFIYEPVPGVRTHWGFIAQEVKQAVDDAGVDFGGWVLTDKDDPDSEQALRYDQFIAPLTKALQEALEKIETLEAKVTALEAA